MLPNHRNNSMLAVICILAAVLLFMAGCGNNGAVQPQAPAVKSRVSDIKTIQPADKPDKKAGATRPIRETSPADDAKSRLVGTQQDVQLKWFEKGMIRMLATASEGDVSAITKTGALKKFSGKLYENGKLSSEMTAPKVIADSEKRTITAFGGVHLVSLAEKTVLDAEWIKWDSVSQRVVGMGNVKAKSEAYEITGAAFETDTALKRVRVFNSAKGLKL